MDVLTIVAYVLAMVETVALLMALVFLTRGMKEKKANRKSKKQNVPVDKGNYIKAGIFGLIYLVLNVLRNSGILG